MAHDARHRLDGPISNLQARINKEIDPIEQDKLHDIMNELMDIRGQDLRDMGPKVRRMDVWAQRLENDTWDLY